MDKCVFCEEPLSNGEPTSTLRIKGCEGIAKANELRNRNISTVPGQVVHVKCRKDFCSPQCIVSDNKKRGHDSAAPSSSPCARRSTSMAFNYKENCIFCGVCDAKKKNTNQHINLSQSEQWISRRP